MNITKQIFKYFFVVMLLLAGPLKAEQIKNVKINGNKRVSDETVKIYGEINSYKTFSEINSNKILKNLLGQVFLKMYK